MREDPQKYLNAQLYLASASGNMQDVMTALSYGAEINCLVQGQRPLSAALKNGCIEIAEYLLKHKANVDARDSDKNTPIILAASSGNLESVHLLIEYKADLNLINAQHTTALMMAGFNIPILKALLNAGADKNIRDEFGNNVLHQACFSNKSSEAIKLFLEYGIDIEAVNEDRCTALLISAEQGYVNNVKLLLASGADIYAKDMDGHDALSLNIQKYKENANDKRKEVIEFLEFWKKMSEENKNLDSLIKNNDTFESVLF